jgi:beta-glucosidase
VAETDGGMQFPAGFLWGAATAGHQVEGNDVNSDVWLLENVHPTVFAERAADACDSFSRWNEDLDLLGAMGLNSYRFSLEWSRIEPDEGYFSPAMLEHYRAMIAGCRQRGITPVVTFNHFTAPRWFAAAGGWEVARAADRFARYCERAARALAGDIGYATTLNEPNALRLLPWLNLPFPADFQVKQQAMLNAAARACGSQRFVPFVAGDPRRMLAPMIKAHARAYAAIKGVRPELPVGVSLAIVDDQAVGPNSRRDEKRREVYGAWMDECNTHADFVGVQNYGRQRIDARGPLPTPEAAERGQTGDEIYPPSLEGALRYAHEASGKPVMVTENGIATADDTRRVAYIPQVLAGVGRAIRSGVPVLGYIHWSLLDNFEWVFGYGPKFGLVAVDRRTQARMPKASAELFGSIARRNRV